MSDIARAFPNVRFWPKADMAPALVSTGTKLDFGPTRLVA